MNNKNIKQIPYGLANYERLVQKNCYYVDKTMYLEALEPFLARYQGVKYSYLLEIKYIKPGKARKATGAEVKKLKAMAKTQLNKYSLDEKFKKNIEKTTLIKLILIFSGHELIDMANV